MYMTSIILALCSAFLLILSFPNFHFGFLVWFAFIPVLLGIRSKKAWQSFLMFWMFGVVFFIGITPWWLKEFQSVSIFASGLGYLYLGLYFGLFGLFLSLMIRRTRLPLLTAAPVWVVFEYLRSNLSFLAFPWLLLGHSQYQNLALIQMASFTGVYGVSFIIVLVNAAIADLIAYLINPSSYAEGSGGRGQERRRSVFKPLYRGGFVLLLILSLWMAGYISLRPVLSGKSLSVAVVQGNIPQKIKWKKEYRDHIFSKYENLTAEASQSNPQLIVWPETSTPGLILKDMTLYQRMISIVRSHRTYFFIGSAEYPKFEKDLAKAKRSGNTAILFSPEGKVLGQYLKIRLVPFGEYVPYEGKIQWPEFILPKEKRSFDIAGTEEKIFDVYGVRFGTLICWEVLFPEMSRALIQKGADFLINLTNEAWFGKIAFPNQMLSSCVFRSVENRVNLIRCANTGISCFIDPYGRVTGKVTKEGKDIFVEGTLTQKIYISPTGTFYSHYGDVFAYGCIAFFIGFLIYSISLKRAQCIK